MNSPLALHQVIEIMADQAAFNMYESASLPTDDLPLNPKGKWEYIGWIPIV